ncbi:MAG: (d)CMP kinase [Lachnospiraceae bacterium]|nr:(d)CMP kinase [Lachnospiraceae bacterium]
MKVAIDGPAGAGKSTLAKAVAKKLGFVYIDTGAMYRAIGLYMLDRKVELSDETALKAALDDVKLDIAYENDAQQVYLNGENVTGRIRTEAAGDMASKVSTLLPVREKLVMLQQEMAERIDVVMDGRDIGTVVLPNAELKVYFTAGSRVRAERRFKELSEKGITGITVEEIEEEIIARDYRDMHREHSPLKQAEDAILVDSSDLTIEEGVERVIALINERR